MRFGSSPLTRGARVAKAEEKLKRRLIPAHAGSTSSAMFSSRAARAHPRSRGEHKFVACQAVSQSGSSPLTRGAPGDECFDAVYCGLIPAHAGSTSVTAANESDPRAHPRSRGEHTCCATLVPSLGGSSPLTRGAPHIKEVPEDKLRLIPAHAGSTCSGVSPSSSSEAHPRSRGEHRGRPPGLRVVRGSSPLTRGALKHVTIHHMAMRLIPAHAGSTCSSKRRRGSASAHPRSRGEHALQQQAEAFAKGSSPLTRGARNLTLKCFSTRRLIPAHAGSTARCFWLAS